MPADAPEFREIAGRPTIRLERHYPHPIDKVWTAVTDPEHLRQWFPSPVEVDLRPGGAMRFAAFESDAGDQDGATGTVDEVQAPCRLSFRWGDDHVTFDLTSEDGGTTFALTHSFDDRYGGPSFATGWEVCLNGLRSVLAGEQPPPPSRGIERHEELVHEFGLDAPEVTRTASGWTVRIARQLMCPAEVAWNLWMGTDRVTGEQRSAPDVGEAMTPYMAPDVVIGTMTEVDPYRVMAFDIAPTGGPGEHLRLELTEGTGHGARIVVTVNGTRPAECDEAAGTWGTGAVGHLASMGVSWAQSNAAADG